MGIMFSSLPTIMLGGAESIGNYNNYNVSDFSEDEVGSDVTSVLDTIFRFVLFATIGFGLPSGTPFYIQIFISAIAVLMTTLVIFTIKNAIWKG